MPEFSNPLYKRAPGDKSPEAQPDPYMIEYSGSYYVYATGATGVICYRSHDITQWEYCGTVLTESGKKEYWAPSVIIIDGVFYMYYSCMPQGVEDTHLQSIRVAVSDSPLGPFEYKKELLPPFSIDPHVVKNKKNELYMFYSVNDYSYARAGTYIVADKMTDPFNMEGKPVSAVRPTLDEEIFQKDRFIPGQHWHTIEGAFYFFFDGMHYLMYSGSAFTKESYFVGYCTAQGDGYEDLRELKYNKRPDDNTYLPLLKKNEFVEGTGHNSVIVIDGKFFIVYHGRTVTSESEKNNRI